ncbi:hypothetical protein LMG26846_02065 [Achromobacter insuavis]|uniref:hypothetical protein n=1 Tax=Achromobacter insuavis TaxID=1287735 RepID=UPI001467A647|nr:hypothetical protein [Achromobacter insuavis]CAB3852450.1 hypothetical protein LMG26846_02065 [Achromobacter insuavis]
MHEFKPQPPIVLTEGDRYLAEGDLIAVPLHAMPGGLVEFVLVRSFTKEEICNVFQVNARDLEALPTYRFSKPQVPTVFALEAAAIALASKDSKG